MKSIREQVIEYIGFNPEDEKECLRAIKNWDYNIRWIKNPTEEMQELAISINPYDIFYIHNSGEKIKNKVIDRDSISIQYIHNPSKELQIRAIRNSRYNIWVIVLCDNWEEFKEEIRDNIRSDKSIKELITEEIGFNPEDKSECLKAVYKDSSNIKYIKNPTEEMYKLLI